MNIIERLKELYEEGILEFQPQSFDGDIMIVEASCSLLNPNPVYVEVNKFDYRTMGNELCMEKLSEILEEDESVSLS